jgi:hypothetical protein
VVWFSAPKAMTTRANHAARVASFAEKSAAFKERDDRDSPGATSCDSGRVAGCRGIVWKISAYTLNEHPNEFLGEESGGH